MWFASSLKPQAQVNDWFYKRPRNFLEPSDLIALLRPGRAHSITIWREEMFSPVPPSRD